MAIRGPRTGGCRWSRGAPWGSCRRTPADRAYSRHMAPGGFFGQALVVDVRGDHATGTPLTLDDRVLRAYLGGVGLGTWLMHRLGPPRVDPLAPAAPLAFVFS